MKKFNFSLDKVLDFKQQSLESARMEHAAILVRVRQQEDVVAAAWQKYRDYNRQFCECKEIGISVSDALMYQTGLRAAERQIQMETALLERLQRQEEQKRSVVIDAKIDVDALEKLRKKKREAYNKALSKEEEQFIDDLVGAAKAVSG